MNANELLATIAGLNEITQPEIQDEALLAEYEEVNYDELNPDNLFDDAKPRQPAKNSRGGRTLRRELQGLSFANPGGEMSKYLPDSSDIINTKRSRRVVEQDVKDEELHHDKSGKLTSTTKGHTIVLDLCDCLDEECSGCNWPCSNCKSRKCMVGCRQNRKDMLVKIEEMYTIEGSSGHNVVTNPIFPYAVKD